MNGTSSGIQTRSIYHLRKVEICREITSIFSPITTYVLNMLTRLESKFRKIVKTGFSNEASILRFPYISQKIACFIIFVLGRN